MSSDDQHFLDLLSSIPNDVRRYSHEVADSLDRHFEYVASSLRESLAQAHWLPDVARPVSRANRGLPARAIAPPRTYLATAEKWVQEHKILTGAAVVGFSAILYIYFARSRKHGKRRAKRDQSGTKREAVVIAGSLNEPSTRALALDLERRGFVVYVIVGAREDEESVLREQKPDLRPLYLDISDPFSAQTALQSFNASLPPLHLSALLLFPSPTYISAPLETSSPELWSDALNARVLAPILTTQLFIPLLIASKARFVLLTPSIMSSLAPPFHSLETTVVHALSGFSASLYSELAASDVKVSHIKMGNIEIPNQNSQNPRVAAARTAEVLSWPPAARASYARGFLQQGPGSKVHNVYSGITSARGSPFRHLQNAIFDAIADESSRTQKVVHVGRGSLLYDRIGRWMPETFVSWMVGLHSVPRPIIEPQSGSGSGSETWERVEQ